MALTNREVAQIFSNIADILEIQGESRFRYLSYRRAGEELAELPRDLQAYLEDGTLRDIPGVGKAIADKITELLETGTLEYYEKRKAEVPLGVVEIKHINGVGPKKAKLFWEELDITSIEALQAAAEAGKLRELAGMGKKSEQKVLDGIAAIARRSDRTPIGKARPAAERILAHLMRLPEAQEGVVAGSIRRARATIGDVDILIASDDAQPIMDAVVSMDEVARVLGHGDTKSSVELHSGLQVDVRVLPKQRWGTAIQYFTGSQAHNIKVREIAREKGYSLNEDALRPIDENGDLLDESEFVYCDTEEAVYETIGLAWVPPELREDNGEIEQAKAQNLPALITINDIIADLHMHTTYSDGKLTILEMAQAAKERGMQYIAITDHSQMQAQAGGLKPEEALAQGEAIRQANAEIEGIEILHGIEVDIKADGTLDFEDDVLAQFDWVVASPHVALRQDKDAFTNRLVKAIQNPHVDCIGHPTGRLIGTREPAQISIDPVIAAAAEHKTALEINANPARLDLDAQYVRLAVEAGVLISINTDAHDAAMMDVLDYGIHNARRGWLTPQRVINTWTFEKFKTWLTDRS